MKEGRTTPLLGLSYLGDPLTADVKLEVAVDPLGTCKHQPGVGT